MERAHRVEEVGDGAHAEVERRRRLLGGGVAVAERHGHAALEQARDQRAGARELRRERHQPDRAAVEQPVEQRQVGVAARAPPTCVPSRRGERNGPSRCTPRIRGCPPSAGTSRERGEQLLLGRGDQGGEVGGHARLEQRLAGAAVAVGVGVEEVDAAEAVDLEVDEAGHGEAAPVRPGEPAADDPAVLDLDVAVDEPPVDEGRLDAEPHVGRSRSIAPDSL